MKILVIGSNGNMGRRYMVILKYLGVESVGIDLGMNFEIAMQSFDRAIIATDTPAHQVWVESMIHRGIPFLCEKPISKDLGFLDWLKHKSAEGRMVSNWAFVKPGQILSPGKHEIEYDCYNTGKDGLAFDCIQLIHLAKGFPKLQTDCPTFKASIDGELITLDAIADSYVTMIKTWLTEPEKLWNLEEAKKATEKTLSYMESHK